MTLTARAAVQVPLFKRPVPTLAQHSLRLFRGAYAGKNPRDLSVRAQLLHEPIGFLFVLPARLESPGPWRCGAYIDVGDQPEGYLPIVLMRSTT